MPYTAKQVSVLQAERTNDPLVLTYSGMDDAAFLASITGLTRTRNRDTMTGSEIYNSIDETEWLALTDIQRQEIWDILHLGADLNPFGLEATRFIAIFGVGTTLSALADLRTVSISRAAELGLPTPTLFDIARTV